MEKFYKKSVGLAFAMLIAATMAFAQTTVTGTVKDERGDPLPGVNVTIKGSIAGTISDGSGNFTLKANQNVPLTLIFSFIGYKPQEIQITNANTTGLGVALEISASELSEITITGTRQPENWMKSSTTIEVMTLKSIQESSTIDPYEALSQIKGVQTTSSSMNFQQINTRGFATIANERFVQWVDGIDTNAPILNFPTGNIVGIGELDMESLELIPGAASALYGPNAFNGILLMNSKSPFLYQGLSAQFKGGVTTSQAQNNEKYPLYNFGIRYAKAFNDKFAFKVNFSIFDAEDWRGNDYKTDRLFPESRINRSGIPDFDGLNLYGDEYALVTVPGIDGSFRRTGYREEDLIDNYSARSIKGDVAIHYRITDKLEALYNYRYGSGNAIYQGDAKYALRNFTQEFHKVELKADNFFVRGYLTSTDAGDSYNLLALGTFMNENYAPTQAVWAPDYINAYNGYIDDPNYSDPNFVVGSHSSARRYADRNLPSPGTPGFENNLKTVRNNYFQRTPAGAKFIDNSRLWHGEFNYNFKNEISWAEVMIGGNYRQYDLFTDGTILNEDPDADSPSEADPQRIKIGEYGVYTQLAKQFGAFKITGSIRYDKNENFKGQVTPKLAFLYLLKDENEQTQSIRASFQTGFRNPQTQAQFIYFPASDGTLLGSTKANAERYGVHNGGAWTRDSYNTFRTNPGNPGTIDANGNVTSGDATLLKETKVPYVQPEQLTAFEIGYKGRFRSNFLIDLNGYYNIYKDFIGTDFVVSDHAITHQGVSRPAGTIFSLYSNSPEQIQSYGVGVGVTYKVFKDYTVSANYNYADFSVDKVEGRVFNAGFNTPNNKFNVGLGNSKVTENLGFNINFRWQEEFLWQSSFGEWIVPAFGLIDAQISYRVSSLKSIFKIGGTNIGGNDYRTNLGGPFVGQQYYISITFDEMFK
jgi:iron complex outermembrane recepter protein